MNTINNKKIHNYLDLDYNNPNISIEDQTNLLINNTINNFCKTYGTQFNKRLFVLEFNDDCLSLISYRILVAIREITDLKFILCGKPKKFKNYIKKTELIYSPKKVLKIDTPPVLISCNHILYKVYNIPRKNCILFDNNMSSNYNYNLIERFTPDEIYCAMNFYGFKFANTTIRPTTPEWIGLNNFLRNPFEAAIPPVLNSYLNKIPSKLNLYLVYITGNNEKDCESLRTVEQVDDIVYYFYEGIEPPILKDINYTTFVKNKSNIPCKRYGNTVEGKEWIDALWHTNQINWVGEWTQENKDWVLNKR